MQTRKFKPIITTTFTLLLIALFYSTSIAAVTGTDSKGSYSYGDDSKTEGSKTKSPAYNKGTQRSVTKRGEGSGNKSYIPSKHGYTHKSREGSGKKYSDGSGHRGSYGPGYGKSYGPGYGKSHSPHKRYGHGSAHRSGKSPFEHVLCFTKKLGLTKAQVEKIKAHDFEFKKMQIQAQADHAIAHMELDRLAHSNSVDEAGMRALGNRIVEIKSRKIHAMIEAKITILKILTAEQRQKVSQIYSSK